NASKHSPRHYTKMPSNFRRLKTRHRLPEGAIIMGLWRGSFMPQLGFGEMLVILIIALLVFGPKKLPELGKSLGKGIRKFKKATNDLKANWEDQVRDAQDSIEDVKQDVKQTIHDATPDLHLNEPVKEPAAKEATHNGPSN